MLENLCLILIQKALNLQVKPLKNKLKSKNQNSKLKKRNPKKKHQKQKKKSNQKHLNQLKNQSQPNKSQKSTLELKERKPENPFQDSDKELPKDWNNLKIIMLFLLPSKKSICSLPQNAEKNLEKTSLKNMESNSDSWVSLLELQQWLFKNSQS